MKKEKNIMQQAFTDNPVFVDLLTYYGYIKQRHLKGKSCISNLFMDLI